MKPETSSVDAIGDFYTNHPYPPPIDNLDRARDMWKDQNVHRAEYHLFWPHKQYRADIDVLIAGPKDLRKRLHVGEKEISAASLDSQGNKVVSVSAK